ncbi:MAG: pentapeptide repeat-containing protein [Pseudomonadota bacterium]
MWVAIPVGAVFYLWIGRDITRDLPGLADQGLTRLAAIMAQGDAAEIRNIAYAVGALLGALAILATIPFQLIKTWMNERAALTAEAGQITDRINKAVEQLGAEKTVKDADGERTVANLEVRLGGIYALERIAQDSLRDHIQVMEILTAYIRHNAPTKGHPMRKEGEDLVSFLNRLKGPRIDIQAAITVIGRRGDRQIEVERKKGYRLDLRDCCLRKADMSGEHFNLDRARMSASLLEKAILIEARMEGANLTAARMEGANLTAAQMERADFFLARMEGAHLNRARMEGAFLVAADLTDARGLTQEALNSALGDPETILPERFERPSHWDGANDRAQVIDKLRTWLATLPASKARPDGS